MKYRHYDDKAQIKITYINIRDIQNTNYRTFVCNVTMKTVGNSVTLYRLQDGVNKFTNRFTNFALCTQQVQTFTLRAKSLEGSALLFYFLKNYCSCHYMFKAFNKSMIINQSQSKSNTGRRSYIDLYNQIKLNIVQFLPVVSIHMIH